MLQPGAVRAAPPDQRAAIGPRERGGLRRPLALALGVDPLVVEALEQLAAHQPQRVAGLPLGELGERERVDPDAGGESGLLARRLHDLRPERLCRS